MSESSHEKKPTLNADMFEHVSAFGNVRLFVSFNDLCAVLTTHLGEIRRFSYRYECRNASVSATRQPLSDVEDSGKYRALEAKHGDQDFKDLRSSAAVSYRR